MGKENNAPSSGQLRAITESGRDRLREEKARWEDTKQVLDMLLINIFLQRKL